MRISSYARLNGFLPPDKSSIDSETTALRRRDMGEIDIIKGYVPGAIGRIAELHGLYYGIHWGFGLFFEAKVAGELAGFLARYDDHRDGFWIASHDGRIEGSITVDGLKASAEGAHLRWFIVSDALRGQGIGNNLLGTAVDFCKSRGYRRAYLWTFEGLDPARHIYEKNGFILIESRCGNQWGTEVTEQRFEWTYDAS